MRSNRLAMWMIVLVGLLAGGTLWAQQAPEPVSRPAQTLLFLGSANHAPYSFLDRDGQPAGYDVDVLQAVAERLGLTVEIKLLTDDAPDVPGARSGLAKAMQAVRAGEAAGVLALGDIDGEAERRQQWRFTGPTDPVAYSILVGRDTEHIDNLQSLNGSRVAIIRYDPAATLFAVNPNVTLDPARHVQEGVVMVQRGRVTALVAPRNAVLHAAKSWNLEDVKFVGVPVFRQERYGPALPAEDQSGLAGRIQRALAEMNTTGALIPLQAKYGFGGELAPLPLLEQPWVLTAGWVSLAVVVLILLGLMWFWSLRSGVQGQTRRLTAEIQVLRRQLTELQTHPDRPHESAPPADEGGLIPMALNDLIRQLGPKLQEISGGEVAVELQLVDELPGVLADPVGLEDALIHLCRNARDAVLARREKNPESPMRMWVITRPARPDEVPPARQASQTEFVALAVRDTGIGIAQKDVPEVFKDGYTTKPGAAGHGLAAVYGVVARHGGWIDVESAPNRGATFSLYLEATDEE